MTKKIKIAAICIGDELLKGFTVNTNLSDIGSALLKSGFVVDRAVVIPDTKEAICNSMHDLIGAGMDLIIMTGGLGPTVDDLTKSTVAEACGLDLIVNNEVAESLKVYWSRRNKEMPESVMSQALVPEGSLFFPNEVGTAPGLLINLSETQPENSPNGHPGLPAIILLPGPPSEMNPMLGKYVIPYIKSLPDFEKLYTNTIHVAGLPESHVENKTLPLVKSLELSVAYCASPEAVKVYLSGNNIEKLNAGTEKLREVLREYALPEGSTTAVDEIVNYCIKNSLTLSVAESCTGGLIAAAVTDIPGTSQIFKGGIVSYSNEWKHELLGVSSATLEKYGAVSYECAMEMVSNLCEKYNSDMGISVTGIAGPGGGTPEKQVGLVYIGVKFREKTVVKKFEFPGNRKRVRKRTVYAACNLLCNLFK